MNTLLIQIEGILNSRPLCAITDDPDDLDALTPGHILIGSAINALPEPSLIPVKYSRLNLCQRVQWMVQLFWDRWSKEYLQRYHSTYKWNHPKPPIKEGSLVLITDEKYPPSKWPLGRVIALFPGKDGLIRVVKVKTQSNEFTRPISKICPLPVDTTPADFSPNIVERRAEKC